MMRNSLVEIQNAVVEQLSRNLLIMRTLFENRLPPNFLVLSIIIFRVEQAGSVGAANTASSRRIRRCCVRFKPAPLATHQPPALRTSLWNQTAFRPVRIDGVVWNFTQHFHLGSGTGWSSTHFCRYWIGINQTFQQKLNFAVWCFSASWCLPKLAYYIVLSDEWYELTFATKGVVDSEQSAAAVIGLSTGKLSSSQAMAE